MSVLSAATERTPATVAETLSPATIDGRTLTADVSGRKLAVCERSDRSLHLCREREVGVFVETPDPDDKSKTVRKRDRKAGTENIWKVTSDVADIAHALESGLLD